MASAVVLTVIGQPDWTGNSLLVKGTVAVGAGNYATPGLAMSFAGFDKIKSSSAPSVLVEGTTDAVKYTYVPGTTPANGKLQIWTGGSEVADGATPASVTGDTIGYLAWFPRI